VSALQIGFGYACPNCGHYVFVGYFHDCPALRRLSPLGGGPNPWRRDSEEKT
jgi:hypothetical protein